MLCTAGIKLSQYYGCVCVCSSYSTAISNDNNKIVIRKSKHPLSRGISCNIILAECTHTTPIKHHTCHCAQNIYNNYIVIIISTQSIYKLFIEQNESENRTPRNETKLYMKLYHYYWSAAQTLYSFFFS